MTEKHSPTTRLVYGGDLTAGAIVRLRCTAWAAADRAQGCPEADDHEMDAIHETQILRTPRLQGDTTLAAIVQDEDGEQRAVLIGQNQIVRIAVQDEPSQVQDDLSQ